MAATTRAICRQPLVRPTRRGRSSRDTVRTADALKRTAIPSFAGADRSIAAGACSEAAARPRARTLWRGRRTRRRDEARPVEEAGARGAPPHCGRCWRAARARRRRGRRLAMAAPERVAARPRQPVRPAARLNKLTAARVQQEVVAAAAAVAAVAAMAAAVVRYSRWLMAAQRM